MLFMRILRSSVECILGYRIYIYKAMRILKPFMSLIVIGVLYSCAAVPLQTYRNGYIMDKDNVVAGYYSNGYVLDSEKNVIGYYANISTILAMKL